MQPIETVGSERQTIWVGDGHIAIELGVRKAARTILQGKGVGIDVAARKFQTLGFRQLGITGPTETPC